MITYEKTKRIPIAGKQYQELLCDNCDNDGIPLCADEDGWKFCPWCGEELEAYADEGDGCIDPMDASKEAKERELCEQERSSE